MNIIRGGALERANIDYGSTFILNYGIYQKLLKLVQNL